MLAMVPMLILGVVAGLAALVEQLPAGLPRKLAAGSLGLLILAPAGISAVRVAVAPPDPAPAEAAVRELEAARRPDDVIYVYSRVVPVWAYYTTDWAAPDRARLEWLLEASRRIGPNSGNRPTRGTAVRREGDDLARPGPFGVELIGIATGIEHPTPPDGRSTPDPGWSENEVRRIQAACTRSAWLFFSHGSDAAEAELLPLLRKAGLQEEHRSLRRAVRLYRYGCAA
jgi:hypothetical protein